MKKTASTGAWNYKFVFKGQYIFNVQNKGICWAASWLGDSHLHCLTPVGIQPLLLIGTFASNWQKRNVKLIKGSCTADSKYQLQPNFLLTHCLIFLLQIWLFHGSEDTIAINILYCNFYYCHFADSFFFFFFKRATVLETSPLVPKLNLRQNFPIQYFFNSVFNLLAATWTTWLNSKPFHILLICFHCSLLHCCKFFWHVFFFFCLFQAFLFNLKQNKKTPRE